MAFDLDTAYGRTGLAVTPENDILLGKYLDLTLAVVEQYLDRLIMYGDDDVEVIFHHGHTIQLKRFPIKNIRSMTGSYKYELHNDVGLIVFDREVANQRIEIEYSGGYLDLPMDLEMGLWITFDYMYALGSSSSASAASVAVESVTIQGVGTVRFALGDTSGDTSTWNTHSPHVPLTAKGFLWPYRLESA